MSHANLLALSSAFAFAGSSLIWRHFAARVSSYWANAFKNTVSLIGFSITLWVVGGFGATPSWETIVLMGLSGVLGLTLGDFFLIQSYLQIGPARTFVISSFQPLFLGLLGFIFLGQGISGIQAVGILAMMACVFTLGYEVWHHESFAGLHRLKFALIYLVLDGLGLFFARMGFELSPSLPPLDANFYRCAFATLGFVGLSRIWSLNFYDRFVSLRGREKAWVIGASLLGTFIGLLCRLEAISSGHLATVIAIAGSTPVIAAALESIAARKLPSRYLWISLALFGVGLGTILFGLKTH